MYVNYINDRKQLGYKAMKDTNCGIKLVRITESTVLFLLIRNRASNSKRKAKRVILYATFIFKLGQPLVPYAAAVMMPLSPVAIHRLSPIEQDRILSNKNGYPQIAPIPESKVDKIRLTNDQIKQFNNLALQLNSGSIKMEEAILQHRGGNAIKLSKNSKNCFL